MTGEEKAKQIAAQLVDEVQGLGEGVKNAIGDLKRSRGFWTIVRHAKEVLPPLVRTLERFSMTLPGKLSGAEKRAIALESVMLLLPALPWWAPKWLVRRLLGSAIDAAVKLLNDHYGKGWPILEA